jgi:hypothetical protein
VSTHHTNIFKTYMLVPFRNKNSFEKVLSYSCARHR